MGPLARSISPKTTKHEKFSEEAILRDASIDWEQAIRFSGDANLFVLFFPGD